MFGGQTCRGDYSTTYLRGDAVWLHVYSFLDLQHAQNNGPYSAYSLHFGISESQDMQYHDATLPVAYKYVLYMAHTCISANPGPCTVDVPEVPILRRVIYPSCLLLKAGLRPRQAPDRVARRRNHSTLAAAVCLGIRPDTSLLRIRGPKATSLMDFET